MRLNSIQRARCIAMLWKKYACRDLGTDARHDATVAFQVFQEVEALRVGMPLWYTKAMEGGVVSEAKLTKLRHRLDTCNCVVGIGMVPDVNGRVSQEDEEWAVASAVQNMHLMCTAYGLGAKWTTPSFMKLPKSRLNLDCRRGQSLVGYPDREWPESHRWPLEFVTRWKTDSDTVVQHERKPTV